MSCKKFYISSKQKSTLHNVFIFCLRQVWNNPSFYCYWGPLTRKMNLFLLRTFYIVKNSLILRYACTYIPQSFCVFARICFYIFWALKIMSRYINSTSKWTFAKWRISEYFHVTKKYKLTRCAFWYSFLMPFP